MRYFRYNNTGFVKGIFRWKEGWEIAQFIYDDRRKDGNQINDTVWHTSWGINSILNNPHAIEITEAEAFQHLL